MWRLLILPFHILEVQIFRSFPGIRIFNPDWAVLKTGLRVHAVYLKDIRLVFSYPDGDPQARPSGLGGDRRLRGSEVFGTPYGSS